VIVTPTEPATGSVSSTAVTTPLMTAMIGCIFCPYTTASAPPSQMSWHGAGGATNDLPSTGKATALSVVRLSGSSGGMPVRNRNSGGSSASRYPSGAPTMNWSTSSQRIWYSRTVRRLPAHGFGT